MRPHLLTVAQTLMNNNNDNSLDSKRVTQSNGEDLPSAMFTSEPEGSRVTK